MELKTHNDMVRLTVYAIKAHGNYGGGMAIVAATDKGEAELLAAPLDRQWHTRFDAPESVDVLPVQCEGEPRVLAWYATGE